MLKNLHPGLLLATRSWVIVVLNKFKFESYREASPPCGICLWLILRTWLALPDFHVGTGVKIPLLFPIVNYTSSISISFFNFNEVLQPLLFRRVVVFAAACCLSDRWELL